MILTPNVSFDPAKDYYLPVKAYLLQVHGIFEMFSRGLIEQNSGGLVYGEPIHIPDPTKAGGWTEPPRAGQITPLIRVPKPPSKALQGPIEIDWAELTLLRDIHHTADMLGAYTRSAAGSLLITAWETTKAAIPPGGVREFFRHCRNAAAHRNVFTFQRNQPTVPARWRGLEVIRSLAGKPLFDGPSSFILPGDVLVLLSDVEKLLP